MGCAISVWTAASGHYKKFFPIRPGAIWRDLIAALTFRLQHEAGVYNAVQKLLYLFVLLAGVAVVISGFAIWKPVQLWPLCDLCGGYFAARYVHFFAMAAIAGFLAIHLLLVLLVPKTLPPMLLGASRKPMNPIGRRKLLFRALALGAISTPCPPATTKPRPTPTLPTNFCTPCPIVTTASSRLCSTRARSHPLSARTRSPLPPRFNAYYDISQVPVVDEASYTLQLSGQIQDKSAWSLGMLRKLPQYSQITRLICVEGWRVIGQWSGVRLSDFSAPRRRRYHLPLCFLPMRGWLLFQHRHGIRFAPANHPGAGFFGRPPSPRAFGAPVRLRIPTKLGFKNPKSIVSLAVTNIYPRRILGRTRVIIGSVAHEISAPAAICHGHAPRRSAGKPGQPPAPCWSKCSPRKSAPPARQPMLICSNSPKTQTFWRSASTSPTGQTRTGPTPYALTGATDRQAWYATLVNSENVFTPEAVIDGGVQLVGSDQSKIAAAIAAAKTAPAGDIPHHHRRCSQQHDPCHPSVPARVVLPCGCSATMRSIPPPSAAARNGGATLTEANIVRSISNMGIWTGPITEFTISRPAGQHFAFILQLPTGAVLGAAAK